MSVHLADSIPEGWGERAAPSPRTVWLGRATLPPLFLPRLRLDLPLASCLIQGSPWVLGKPSLQHSPSFVKGARYQSQDGLRFR